MTSATAVHAFDYTREDATYSQNVRREAQLLLGLTDSRFTDIDWPQLHMLYPVLDLIEQELDCRIVIGHGHTGHPENPSAFTSDPNLPGIRTVVLARHAFFHSPRGSRSDTTVENMPALTALTTEENPGCYRSYDIDSTMIGLIAPRVISAPWWWYTSASDPEQLSRIYPALRSAVETALDPDFESEWESTRTERLAAQIRTIIGARGSEQLSALRSEVPELVNSISRHESQIRQWETRLDELRAQIRVAEDAVIKVEDIDTMATTELDTILAHPDVLNIDGHTRETLQVFTMELPLVNIETGDETIGGSNRIDLRFGNDATITVHNLTHPVGTYDHPHVSNGQFCLGDQRRLVNSLMTRCELSAAVSVVIDLLKQVNPEDVYTSDWEAWFELS